MDAVEVRAEQEASQGHYFRIARFEELGCPLHQAMDLELAHVDWHELERLLGEGCPLDWALLILAPLED